VSPCEVGVGVWVVFGLVEWCEGRRNKHLGSFTTQVFPNVNSFFLSLLFSLLFSLSPPVFFVIHSSVSEAMIKKVSKFLLLFKVIEWGNFGDYSFIIVVILVFILVILIV